MENGLLLSAVLLNKSTYTRSSRSYAFSWLVVRPEIAILRSSIMKRTKIDRQGYEPCRIAFETYASWHTWTMARQPCQIT